MHPLLESPLDQCILKFYKLWLKHSFTLAILDGKFIGNEYGPEQKSILRAFPKSQLIKKPFTPVLLSHPESFEKFVKDTALSIFRTEYRRLDKERTLHGDDPTVGKMLYVAQIIEGLER